MSLLTYVFYKLLFHGFIQQLVVKVIQNNIDVIEDLEIIVIIISKKKSNTLRCTRTRLISFQAFQLCDQRRARTSISSRSAGPACVLFVLGGYWFCVCPGKYCLLELAASLKSGHSRLTVTGGKRVHVATAFLHRGHGGKWEGTAVKS